MTLPSAKEMSFFATDAERADWLRRCADVVIAGSIATIDNALVECGFEEGRGFLKARFDRVMCERMADGSYPETISSRFYYEESKMNEYIRVNGRD